MKSRFATILVAALSAALPAALNAESPELKSVTASRPPEAKCEWLRVESVDGKYSAVAQFCDYGFRKISHSIEGTALLQKFSDSPTPEKIVEFFSKDPAETPEVTLKKRFIDKLSPYEQKHCVAKETKSKFVLEHPFFESSKSAWVIEPDAVYAAKIKKSTPKGDMPPDSCGEYGLPVDSRAYFEFHTGSPGAFAWVVVGQDTPLFDEQSLRF